VAEKLAIAVEAQPWQGVIVGRKGKLRATPPAANQPVVWRGGVHIVGTPIWCDARRARELCFVSRADRLQASQHGQIIATAETLALMARQGRRPDAASELSVPPGRPFSLGTLRLEVFRSGSAVGAASLSVDLGDFRVVYAGTVNPRGGGLGGAADQRSCAALVVDAHYGDPRFRFPPVDDAVEETVALCRRVSSSGAALVLLVTSALKGLDVAHRLDAAGLPSGCELLAHRSMHHAAQKLRAAAQETPPVRRFAASRVQPGHVLLWPAARRAQLDRVGLPGGSEVALVSGAAADREAIGRARAGHGIAWSCQADHAALRRYVEESGATSVHLVGRFAEQMAAELAGSGMSARPLGPPVQMSLFA
jgi:putative mRNA 3-end processing factor